DGGSGRAAPPALQPTWKTLRVGAGPGRGARFRWARGRELGKAGAPRWAESPVDDGGAGRSLPEFFREALHTERSVDARVVPRSPPGRKESAAHAYLRRCQRARRRPGREAGPNRLAHHHP